MRLLKLYLIGAFVLVVTSIGFAGYTADLCTGGSATASSHWPPYVPSYAFDDRYESGHTDPQYYWESEGDVPEWLQYDFGSGNEKIIAQYRIYTSAEPLAQPDDWTFEGSNNGSSWTALHTVTNAGLALSTWYTYNGFSNSTAYRYYRINISDAETNNGYIDVEEVEMMALLSATVTFTNGANAGLNFVQTNATPPQSNWLCGQFSLTGDAAGATLNSVVVTLGGTYDGSDLQSTPFQLYANSSNSFIGASALGGSVADPGSGGNVTFSSLSDAIPLGTRYYWVTADISATATADDNMNGTVDAAGDLSITGGTLGVSNYGKLNAGTDASLPVFMQQFAAVCVESGVLLSWTTESEVNNAGFILQRRESAAEDWQEIASYKTVPELEGQGNTSSATAYEFVDRNVQWGATYRYRLSDVSMSGEVTVDGVLTIEAIQTELPKVTDLKPVSPNPFNPTTSIHYDLNEETRVTLVVFDLMGRQVQTLVRDQTQVPGSYLQYWNGRDASGRDMPSGTYILHLRTTTFTKSQKMVLMR